MKNKELLLVLVLAASQFFHVIDFVIIMPLGELLMDKLTIDSQEFSLLVAAYTLSAAQLLADYQANEELANERYLDRIISVRGRIKDAPKQLDSTTVLLLGDKGEMASINCSFGPESAPHAARLKEGEVVVVKGRCTGSLLDVNLNRCVLVSP